MWDKYRCVNPQCNKMFVPKYCYTCDKKIYDLCHTCHENEEFYKWFAKKFGVDYRPLSKDNHVRQS